VEGVRAVAAVSVLVFHCWMYGADGPNRADLGLVDRFVLPHLSLGVTLFFSLSGFLLYQPFVTAALSGSPFPKVGSYLRNRALRILPAYWVILLAVGVLLPAALVRQSRDQLVLGRLVENPWLAVGNATLTQGYSPRGLLSGIAPAWSLAVEVVFYLALPLLGLLAVVAARPAATPTRRLLAGLAPAGLLLVVGLSGRAVARFLIAAEGTAPGWNGTGTRSSSGASGPGQTCSPSVWPWPSSMSASSRGWCGCRIVGRCWRWPTRPCSGSRPCCWWTAG
jgi:peptidoglycan/LPS O-acetylase OafA/YrhL